jgi:phage terminase small subunit
MGAGQQLEIRGGKWTIARLPAKMRRFADEYRVSLNATKAYKAAYERDGKVISDAVAAVQGHKLLRKAKVEAYLQEQLEECSKRTAITAERVLVELGRIGFSDIRKFYDKDGKLKVVTELDDDCAACLAGFDYTKASQYTYVRRVKLWDKTAALAMLAKHFKLTPDTVDLGDLGKLSDEELEEKVREVAAELFPGTGLKGVPGHGGEGDNRL